MTSQERTYRRRSLFKCFLLATCWSALSAFSASAQDDGGGVMKQLWETIQQQMKSHMPQTAHAIPNSRKSITEETIYPRRRALFHRTLQRHYSVVLHEMTKHSSPDFNKTFEKVKYVYDYFMHDGFMQRHFKINATDRTTSLFTAIPTFPPSLKKANRKLVQTMFQHAYDSYIYNAWPAAEIKPLSCTPGKFDLVKVNGLTLIDALDTLLIMGNHTEFARAVERLRALEEPLFQVDQNVSVFETNIRVLGGLLSAHQMAEAWMNDKVQLSDVFGQDNSILWGRDKALQDAEVVIDSEVCLAGVVSLEDCAASARDTPTRKNSTKSETLNFWKYDGYLLELATDLGMRLLPAFDTRTGIPFGTVNLNYGVPKDETIVASLAGGGTLTLEFELLSRLTGDERFGRAAKLASRALWMRRSPINLFGKHIEIQSGSWTETLSGIGSNSDSFLEYLIKHFLLFPEDEDFWTMFQVAYAGVFNESRLGEWYADVDMNVGVRRGSSRHVLESLMAFYPGMQVLAGEVAPAARTLNSFFMVREFLGFLPERFNYGNWRTDGGLGGAGKYPLRPELLESCYFLHQSTKALRSHPGASLSSTDSSGWLWAADFALHKLHETTRTSCGFAGIENVRRDTTGYVDQNRNIKYMDEMPSFFLSETLKYLYLTFDDDNILHRDDSHDWVFTTEAHPFHYEPPPKRKNKKSGFVQEVSELKKMLNKKIEGNFVSSGPRRQTLVPEKWTSGSDYVSYRDAISSYSEDLEKTDAILGDNSHASFMAEMRESSDPYAEARSMANAAFVSFRPVGADHDIQRHCLNLHASENLWIWALSGGAVDYSDVYVSSLNDSMLGGKHRFVPLSAAESLGSLGEGLYIREIESSPEKCTSDGEAPSEHDDIEHGTYDTTWSRTQDIGQFESELGNFEISTFPDGAGFQIRHVDSGESLVSIFIADEFGSVMTYSNTPAMKVATSEADEDGFQLHPLGARAAGTSQTAHEPTTQPSLPSVSPERRVVLSDFAGNAFSCRVELLYPESDSLEKIQFPCAPAMFGPSRLSRLLDAGGAAVESFIRGVDDEDLFGCRQTEKSEASEEASIHLVHRGGCTFHDKAVSRRVSFGAQAVIVINSDDSELFTMSNSPEEELNIGQESVPLTVLITGADGERLLQALKTADGILMARVSLLPETSTINNHGAVIRNSPNEEASWPVVRGSGNAFQALARSGWGILARARGEGRSDWELQLLRHETASGIS